MVNSFILSDRFSYFVIFEKIFYSLIFAILLLFSFNVQIKGLIFLAYFLNIRLIIRYSNVIPIFIFFLFSITYLNPFFYYFFLGTKVAIYDSFNEPKFLGDVLQIYCLFLYSIFIFSNPINSYVFLRERLSYNFSNFKFYLSIIFIWILGIFALKGENLLNGAYGHVDKQQSSLFEYSLIFIAISYTYFSFNYNKLVILFLSLAFILFKDLLYGGRITSIQIILLVFILIYENKFSKKIIFLIFFGSYFLFEIFSVIRSNPILFISGDFNILDIFIFQSREYLNTNQGDVVHASARILGLIDVGILNIENRIASFFYFIFSIFTKGQWLPDLVDLSSFKKEIYQSGGGGLFPVFFFVWFSYPGVIFCGFLISRIFKIFIFSKNEYLLLFVCLVMSTYPRWLAYSPISMFKLCIYIIPIYFIFRKISLNLKFNI